jgi:hypothetical protein
MQISQKREGSFQQHWQRKGCLGIDKKITMRYNEIVKGLTIPRLQPGGLSDPQQTQCFEEAVYYVHKKGNPRRCSRR